MPKLDPKGAADAIRAEWAKNPPAPSPDDQHIHDYLSQVLGFLGVAPTSFNIAHASLLLSKLGVEQHNPNEYPKALNVKDKLNRLVQAFWPEDHPTKANQPIVFQNAEEEEAYHAEQKAA